MLVSGTLVGCHHLLLLTVTQPIIAYLKLGRTLHRILLVSVPDPFPRPNIKRKKAVWLARLHNSGLAICITQIQYTAGDVENKPAITSEPDVASVELDGTEDYVVLACDGIWDVIRLSKIPQLVYAHLTGGGSKEMVAKSLVDHAKAEGSSDNMTAIVVFSDTFELKEPPQVISESSEDEGDDEEDDS